MYRDRIIVRLPTESAVRALVSMAERELRDPRDQAAKFIVEGLERAGALPTESATYDQRPSTAVEVG